MRGASLDRLGMTVLALLLVAVLTQRAGLKAEPNSLGDAYRIIASKQFVDLTHTFSPEIPHWKGFKPEVVTVLYTYDKDGFLVQQFTHVGQWGTHVDAPVHFAKGGRTVDQISPKEMILPLVVLDVHEKVSRNPDYVISMNDVRAWESRHGSIPAHAFVAMRTDWSKRWPLGEAAMENTDAKGISHYPGWSLAVLKYLYETRHVTATGHETTDTDPGLATSHNDYSLESWILHHDHYQIELLTNLDKVPESGAIAIVTFPKPKAASGFPARVIAILP
jgi:kynurenine formamidase